MKGTKENSIDVLVDDIEKFLIRYEKLKEVKEKTIMRAYERDTETVASSFPTTIMQSSYALDKFTSYPDLKPKYLEKEANLIEVNTWIC